MRVHNWIMGFAGLPLALLLLAGCESQPATGPLPVRVAQTAAAAAPPAASAPAPAAAASVAASGTFSLPIGAPIPSAAAEEQVPNSPAPFSIPPLAQQPPQGQQPQPATPAPSRTSSPTAAPGPSIHLSAGIAVPQSLPIGTVMALSVDYSFSGERKNSTHYLWVVKSGAGEFVNEVQLEESGNLSAFFQQLRPEHRPFSVRIEQFTPGSKHRTIISNEVTLKTDY